MEGLPDEIEDGRPGGGANEQQIERQKRQDRPEPQERRRSSPEGGQSSPGTPATITIAQTPASPSCQPSAGMAAAENSIEGEA